MLSNGMRNVINPIMHFYGCADEAKCASVGDIQILPSVIVTKV